MIHLFDCHAMRKFWDSTGGADIYQFFYLMSHAGVYYIVRATYIDIIYLLIVVSADSDDSRSMNDHDLGILIYGEETF
ncbi:hypothetical protein D3C76_1307530 [compost metagenome]